MSCSSCSCSSWGGIEGEEGLNSMPESLLSEWSSSDLGKNSAPKEADDFMATARDSGDASKGPGQHRQKKMLDTTFTLGSDSRTSRIGAAATTSGSVGEKNISRRRESLSSSNKSDLLSSNSKILHRNYSNPTERSTTTSTPTLWGSPSKKFIPDFAKLLRGRRISRPDSRSSLASPDDTNEESTAAQVPFSWEDIPGKPKLNHLEAPPMDVSYLDTTESFTSVLEVPSFSTPESYFSASEELEAVRTVSEMTSELTGDSPGIPLKVELTTMTRGDKLEKRSRKITFASDVKTEDGDTSTRRQRLNAKRRKRQEHRRSNNAKMEPPDEPGALPQEVEREEYFELKEIVASLKGIESHDESKEHVQTALPSPQGIEPLDELKEQTALPSPQGIESLDELKEQTALPSPQEVKEEVAGDSESPVVKEYELQEQVPIKLGKTNTFTVTRTKLKPGTIIWAPPSPIYNMPMEAELNASFTRLVTIEQAARSKGLSLHINEFHTEKKKKKSRIQKFLTCFFASPGKHI